MNYINNCLFYVIGETSFKVGNVDYGVNGLLSNS